MIRTVGSIHFRAHVPGQGGFGNHWRYSASEVVVSCDEPGCTTQQTPRGLEHNGPVIECIYGMDGWYMRERDLCPEHAPPAPPETREGEP